MGGCVSAENHGVVRAPAEKISVLILCHQNKTTEFVKYRERVSVAEVEKEYPQEHFFICSWESINVGEKMRRLREWQYLELGEMYFLFPISKLRSIVSVQDLSCLLCKAASALKSLPFPLSAAFNCDGGFAEERMRNEKKMEKEEGNKSRRRRGTWQSNLETIVEVEVA